MQPKFLYFDLGKVLLDFDHDDMCRRIGEAAGIEGRVVRELLFDRCVLRDCDAGRLSTRELYDEFCRQTRTRPDYDTLIRAASDIFTLNVPIVPVVAQLSQAGYRLGILSNTCEAHWEHCLGRFSLLRECFSIHVLSYRIKACKPDAAIFCHAAQQAGCRAEEIFYTDDIQANVDGARAAGFDAVLYTTVPALAAELRQRGLRFNY